MWLPMTTQNTTDWPLTVCFLFPHHPSVYMSCQFHSVLCQAVCFLCLQVPGIHVPPFRSGFSSLGYCLVLSWFTLPFVLCFSAILNSMCFVKFNPVSCVCYWVHSTHWAFIAGLPLTSQFSLIRLKIPPGSLPNGNSKEENPVKAWGTPRTGKKRGSNRDPKFIHPNESTSWTWSSSAAPSVSLRVVDTGPKWFNAQQFIQFF